MAIVKRSVIVKNQIRLRADTEKATEDKLGSIKVFETVEAAQQAIKEAVDTGKTLLLRVLGLGDDSSVLEFEKHAQELIGTGKIDVGQINVGDLVEKDKDLPEKYPVFIRHLTDDKGSPLFRFYNKLSGLGGDAFNFADVRKGFKTYDELNSYVNENWVAWITRKAEYGTGKAAPTIPAPTDPAPKDKPDKNPEEGPSCNVTTKENCSDIEKQFIAKYEQYSLEELNDQYQRLKAKEKTLTAEEELKIVEDQIAYLEEQCCPGCC